jgi:Flp pilus assembly protein TadG
VGDKVSGVISRSIRRFRREDKGVVLILVVLLVVPILIIVAVGIDFGQTLVVKRQLSGAVDAAALAIGIDPTLTEQDDLDAKALAYIKSHYPDSGIGELTSFTVTRTGDDAQESLVDVTATAEIPTNFMKIAGFETLTVTVGSSVVSRQNKLEVVMVLDNSGSMGGGGKLTAMKTAANTLVDILYGQDAVSEDVKVGLVPFTGGVNVNVPSTTPWLDINNPAPLNSAILTLLTGESAFTALELMSGGIASRWKGCVRSRDDPHDTQDTTPDPGNAVTLFSAQFKPFLGLLSVPALYAGSTSDEQNENCPTATVQPISDTKATVVTAVDAQIADGNTNIAEALAWGWRLLSDGEPFTEAAPFTDQSVIKAIILLTDGENQVAGENTFSSYGFGSLLNPQIGPDVNAGLNQKTAEVCQNIKADKDGEPGDQDILIFTIVFNVNSGPILTLMENCASDAGKFFNSPSAGELQSTFEAIAAGLNQLRIAQ